MPKSNDLRLFCRREAHLLLSAMVIFFILITTDLIMGLMEGTPLGHLLIELPIMLSGLGSIVYLLIKLRSERKRGRAYSIEVNSLRSDLQRIKLYSDKFLTEFYEKVISQFDQWNLTPSEKEIGLLLLKGLSFKEMADLRNNSERTIRNHAVSIYNRSGLSGRHEFAAFFLKDMILTPYETSELIQRSK